MKNFNKLLRFAKQLELKYLIAQDVPAATPLSGGVDVAGQDAKVREVLQNNGLMDSNLASPFVAQAGIPNDASINIVMNIKPGYSVSFTPVISTTKPNRGNFTPGPAGDLEFKTAMTEYEEKMKTYPALEQKLSGLLFKGLSKKVFEALKKENPPVTDLVKIKWVEFK